MRTVFVTSTNTNDGKTFYTLKLIKELTRMRVRVHAIKPIESGVDKRNLKQLKKSDSFKIAKALQKTCAASSIGVKDVCFSMLSKPSSVYVADPDFELNLLKSYMNAKKEDLRKKTDVLLIEGAGGIFNPIKIDYFMLDLALEFSDKILLISNDKLGCINNILINKKVLDTCGMEYKIQINIRNKDRYKEITKPFIDKYFQNTIERGIEELIEWVLGK